ncbi:MAG: nucleotide pyrophosphohydrolase [Planctomycetota bacterium]|nr:MAG: nucleotide pyrophosphohydrolase [Planctomycetota bacterium]
MEIEQFQKLIERIYLERDKRRGIAKTYMWFVEEVGELARSIQNQRGMEEEFADVLAWLATLASLSGISLEKAIRKYSHGCPRCNQTPCACPFHR